MNGQRCAANDRQKLTCDGAVSKRPLSRQSVKTSERMHALIHSLADQGLISQANTESAMQEVDACMEEPETVLLDKYQVPKIALGTALGAFYRCPYLGYDERTLIEADLLKNLSYDYLKMNAWVPLKRQGSVIHVLMSDPHDVEKGFDIRRAFPGCTIRTSVGLCRDIEQFLLASLQHRKRGSIAKILGDLVKEAEDVSIGEAPVRDIDEHDSAIVRLASQIIAEADHLGASDVHIEPYSEQKETAIRFRVDGSCFTYMRIPAT